MSRPKCPNHAVEMERSDEPRIYICPISDARFECATDDQSKKTKFDKFGNPMQEYEVTPLDGEGG
jgi:hypothetical protein